MKSAILTLLLLCAAAIDTDTASANDVIVFKLRDYQDKPVTGRVDMRTAEKSWFPVLRISDGDGSLQNAKCDAPGIFFRAASFDLTYYLDEVEREKSCKLGEITFRFRSKDYAALLRSALNADSPVISAASPKAQQLHSEMLRALESGDFPFAATRSLLLKDEIEKANRGEAAAPFEVLATDLAASALTPGQPLIYDQAQRKYVLAPLSIDALVAFQYKSGVRETGRIDWTTAKSLPDFKGLAVGTINMRAIRF